MKHSPHSSRNDTDNLFHETMAALTRGWWPVMVRFYYAMIKVNALYLMVFIRKRMGLRMFGFGALFFAGIWNFLALFIAEESWRELEILGKTEGYRFSGFLLIAHLSLFNLFFIVKWIIAGLSLRSRNPFWYRHRLSIGQSILYGVFGKLLRKIRISEAIWMQFVEPVIIVGIGCGFKAHGYVAFGHYLMFAALCLFGFTFRAYTNASLPGQARDEADSLHPLIDPAPPRKTSGGQVIRD